MKTIIAQLNPIVGDLNGNLKKAISFLDKHGNSADLIVFTELFITGYPIEDLAFDNNFLQQNDLIFQDFLQQSKEYNCHILIGGLRQNSNFKVFNSVYLLKNGEILDYRDKTTFANHDVFDENRIFSFSDIRNPFTINSRKIGVLICEELWNNDTAEAMITQSAEALIAINASPFEKDKIHIRRDLSTKYNLPIIYANCIGGQDDLVFDGGSMAFDRYGKLLNDPIFFEEAAISVNLFKDNHSNHTIQYNKYEHIYKAITLGIKDYACKNGFQKIALGLSGGIDSAIVACLACDAIGSENVTGIIMPSMYSSKPSWEDANELSSNLGIKTHILNIEETLHAVETTLSIFKNGHEELTHKNLQARIRGVLLMAYSNLYGDLILTTGNKSEYAVGYATIYGDMCGGYAPIKDVYKMEIYKLCEYRNSISKVIPNNILTKEPTAELGHNQKDSDDLPVYEKLDRILEFLIEHNSNLQYIPKDISTKIIEDIAKLVRIAEYKRSQSPIGPKISSKSFGKGRRYPITNKAKYISS